MSEQIDIDINVNMSNAEEVDELTSKLEAATNEVENLTEQLAGVYMGDIEGDAEALEEQLAEATDEASNLQAQLEEVAQNTEIDAKVNVDNSELDETNEKLEETQTNASNMTTALGGLAGVIGVDQMISTADRINTSWNQLKLTFGGTSESLNDLKLKTSQAADATGLSGGQIRGYFNSMGIAGIQNTDLLSRSFQSLAGHSYQTGQSIDSMQSKIQKMVITGNASEGMLAKMGVSYEDLAAAMGVSADEAKEAFEALDQEGRLEAITNAMGDGAEANEMYKNSYEGLKTQAETAMAGLMGAVGQGVLPVITPMIRGATGAVKGLTSTFQGLPGPVQGVVGSVGGFLAVGTAAIGTLGLLGQVGSGVVGGLRSMKGAYDTVRGAMSTARAVMTALTSAESISEGVRAALAVATGAEAAAETGATAAKTAATGPTAALAIAENSLLWPLLLIVGAVIAVIAVMWYLYNTNETVRNGINWLIAQIQGFISGLQPAISAVIGFATTIGNTIGKVPGVISRGLTLALAVIAPWSLLLTSQGRQAIANFISSVGTALGALKNTVSNALSGVASAIMKPFQDAWNYVKPYVDKIQEGLDIINPFNGFEGYAGYEGYGNLEGTLNSTISNISNNSTSTGNMNVNNNFYGLVEESAADYIVNAVNDRLRREKLLKGA